jgi:hypothetical protein
VQVPNLASTPKAVIESAAIAEMSESFMVFTSFMSTFLDVQPE